MNAQRATLCPACLSTVASDAERCSQCGTSQRRASRGRARAVTTVAVTVLLASGAFVWWRAQSEPTDERSPSVATTADGTPAGSLPVSAVGEIPNPDARATDPPNDAPAAARAMPFRTLRLAAEGANATRDVTELPPALVLGDGRTPAHLLLPLAAFPYRRGITDEDGAELTVVTYSTQAGFILLATSSDRPTATAALPAAASLGTDYDVVDADGRALTAVRVGGRAHDGTALRLDRQIPSVALLFDADERVVGYSLGDGTALALDGVLPWIGQPGQRLTIAETQLRLRQSSPAWLQEDARALLADPAGTPAQWAEAISLLERAIGLARDQRSIEALMDELEHAHRRKLRGLANADAPETVPEAAASLQRLPNRPALLADAVLVAARAGDAARALAWYRQLLSLSPEHARTVADRLGDDLRARGESLLRNRRIQDALDVLAPLVELLPTRADIRAALARALQASGQRDLAAAEAAEAARLDASHDALAQTLAAERSSDGNAVVIPFDPATRTIQTEVSFAGVPLPLIVDTGASLTTIPSALADRLRLRDPKNRRVVVTTAGGEVTCEVVTVPWIQIGKLRLARVEAVVLDLPGALAGSGLLGLNVLNRLHLEIDAENSRLTLRPQGRSRRGR